MDSHYLIQTFKKTFFKTMIGDYNRTHYLRQTDLAYVPPKNRIELDIWKSRTNPIVQYIPDQ